MSNGAGLLPAALVVLAVGGVVGYFWLDSQPKHTVRSDSEPIEVCERYVKNYDHQASYPAGVPVVTKDQAADQYHVVGSWSTFDTRRINYVCNLQHSGETGRWELLRFELNGMQMWPQQ